MTSNLLDFEESFSKYLSNDLSQKQDYYQEKVSFIETIFKTINISISLNPPLLMNFNYTGGGANGFEEINVHGMLNTKVVIGYDSTTETIKTDDIFGLSKEWRKMEIDLGFNINEIGIGSIICYGHSLGEQDYPYFFELFDSCDLLGKECLVPLFFCYSRFGDKEKQRIELEKYKMNAAKLLNAYERYKHPEIQRNTIVTKLKTQRRLYFKEIK